MRTCSLSFRIAVCPVWAVFTLSAGIPAQTPLLGKAIKAEAYGKLPLSFEANHGQTDAQVRFLSRGNGYSLFLTDSAAVLSLRKPEAAKPGARPPLPQLAGKGNAPAPSFKTDVVRMELAGARKGLHVEGADKLPGTANYFIGNDPAKWHSAVPTFAKVHYAGVYPGVALVYYGNQGRLEYDFVVAPHADPKPIRLRFAGARKLKLDPNGDLEVTAANGQIAFHKPIVYQETAGKRRLIEGSFNLLAKNTVSFRLGGYDREQAVVIDPVLAYSTYLGGSTGSTGAAIAVDSTGSVYVTGETADADFPGTTGYLQAANAAGSGVTNVFITKINSAGTGLSFSTYLGGSGDGQGDGDVGLAIAVDAAGDSFITGYTYSSNFPLKNPYQVENKGAANALSSPFVAKLNATGTALIYSTYLGGSSYLYSTDRGDRGQGIAINSAGNAYITGNTSSTDFPVTSNAFQQAVHLITFPGYPSFPAGVAFVTELSTSGNELIYSTYLGGSGIEFTLNPPYAHGDGARGIAVDSAGNAYVVGSAASTDFPTTAGAFQTMNRGAANKASNGFLSKINPTGSALVYSTYLGGSSTAAPILTCEACDHGDGVGSVLVDKAGNAYVAGGTYSSDFPTTTGAYQTTRKGVANAIVSKVNPQGTALLYSTLIGGSGSQGDVAYGLALDSAGNAYLSGFTSSADFPVTPNAFQSINNASSHNATNAFVTEVNPQGTGLLYSTYLGGSGYLVPGSSPTTYNGETGYGIALDAVGDVYVTGSASSTDFPATTGAFQMTNKAGSSAFISKFDFGANLGSGSLTTILASASPSTFGSEVYFTAYVQSTSGGTIPIGSVTFLIDGTDTVPISLDSTGHAIYATNMLSVGTHAVSANYSGDGTHTASSSGILSEIIRSNSLSISVLVGSGQTGVVGSTFSTPIVVQVSSGGVPFPGATVTFSGPGLSFLNQTALSNSSGYAYAFVTPVLGGVLHGMASLSAGTPFVAFTETGIATPSAIPAPLASVTILPTGASSAGASLIAAAADFNGDGYPDLATTNTIDASVSVLLGKGNGSFQAPATYAVGNGPYGVAAGDFNGDGKPDVAVVNGLDNTVGILLNNGMGGFPAKPSFTYPVGSQPYGVSLADLNRDGKLDLVVTNNASKTLTVLLGNGDGTFQAAVFYATGNYPFTTTVADMNNDGYPDLVVQNFGDNTVGVYLNTGAGTFLPQATYATGAGPFGVATGDFNGDGYPDVAVANLSANTLSVLLNDKTGKLLPAVSYAAGSLPTSVVAADLNGDGVLDLGVANLGDGTVGVLLGKGDGTFLPQTTVAAGTQPYSLVTADFNGDGKPDLAVTSFFSNTLGVLLQTPAATAGRLKGPPKPVVPIKTVPLR